MKIHVFDDKAENVESAKAAIIAAGHEYATLEFFNRSAEKLAVAQSEKDARQASTSLFLEIKFAVKKMKECGGGIITDLMFRIGPHHLDRPLPPAGLLVALAAVAAGVPVVICTNTNDVGGHHGEQVSWIFDGFVGNYLQIGEDCPFGWVEDKDWAKAVQFLAKTSAPVAA